MNTSIDPSTLANEISGTDIYLLDQILKEKIRKPMRILDAGCGSGRNVKYLLNSGFDVSAVDENSDRLSEAISLAPNHLAHQFHTCSIEEMPFADQAFDYVICNAVLHFAKSDEHFYSMLNSLWRVLNIGGTLFARLASSIGLEEQLTLLEGRRFTLPDCSSRYLVDEEMLLSLGSTLGASLLEPIKTTIVQNQRAMTTWVIKKN